MSSLGLLPQVGAFNRACIEKRLRETVAHRVETDRTYVDTVRRRRDAQRERFDTLAYSRYIAAVRRQELHAVTRSVLVFATITFESG